MSKKRDPSFKLEEAIRDPGFTPGQRDIAPLLDLLGGQAGEDTEEQAQRALLRAGEPAVRAALLRAPDAPVDARRRLTAFLGRAAAAGASAGGSAGGAVSGAEEALGFLVRALEDEDPKTRRNAAIALGKVHRPEAEAALSSRLERETADGVRRSIVAALGKVGGERALAALGKVGAEGEKSGGEKSGEEEALERARARSALMVTRTLERETPSMFDAAKPAPNAAEGGTTVALRCRSGLEEILVEELDRSLSPRIVKDDVAGARVEVTLTGAPASLFQARTMLSFGFPLAPRPIADRAYGAGVADRASGAGVADRASGAGVADRASGAGDLPDALADALSSPEARRILTHWTTGTVRYRIAWAGGGKRRAAIWRTAEEVARRCPELVNDPRESTWQALVYEGAREIRVELVPRAEDPRFAYRKGDVPAASHPTIAAALVRVAGVRPDDVVWDPFVGSGTELCERAIAGPYRRLIGSDKDEKALAVARANLAAAGARADLMQLDIHSRPALPAAPTLVITNPPMGRRVHRSADLDVLLDRFIERAAEALVPGGRLVWVSPLPRHTARACKDAGLAPFFQKDVDMGGFEAQIQGFRKPAPRIDRGSPRR
jgi:23S rRNA G2445 N2-methylase RlmL